MAGTMKTLTVNGSIRRTDAATVLELLQSIEVHPGTVVVEYNGEIAARADFNRIELREGDTLEIVQMMAGG